MFSDNPSCNNLLYRGSEVLSRINQDKIYLRDNEGPKQELYSTIAPNNCQCEEHLTKNYNAE